MDGYTVAASSFIRELPSYFLAYDMLNAHKIVLYKVLGKKNVEESFKKNFEVLKKHYRESKFIVERGRASLFFLSFNPSS